MKLTKRRIRALAYLSNQLTWCNGMFIPDGNGRTSNGGASNATLSELKRSGFIEYGKQTTHSHYGWRITPAGRRALMEN